jgi:hypothetical protein
MAKVTDEVRWSQERAQGLNTLCTSSPAAALCQDATPPPQLRLPGGRRCGFVGRCQVARTYRISAGSGGKHCK